MRVTHKPQVQMTAQMHWTQRVPLLDPRNACTSGLFHGVHWSSKPVARDGDVHVECTAGVDIVGGGGPPPQPAPPPLPPPNDDYDYDLPV